MLLRARFLSRCSALLALSFFATSCLDGDATGPALEVDPGSARFEFFGTGLDGFFEAQGGFSRNSQGVVKRQSFATGIDVDVPPYLYFGIVAAEFRFDSLNELNVTISGQTSGDYSITDYDSCVAMIAQGSGKCAAISYTLGMNSDGFFIDGTQSFELVEGTLSLTSVSGGRLQGTFSGTSRQLSSSPSESRYVADVEVEITAGDFDVPVITLKEWNGA